jgi:signal transduction histidine kinase
MNVRAPAREMASPGEDEPARASERRIANANVGVAIRPLLAILTVFWIYVTLSDVLYARSMAIQFDPDGKRELFAPWDARVLQHLFLFPLLVGAIWSSLKIGSRPAWRAIPLQVLQAIAFSACASPLLRHSETLVSLWHPSSSSGQMLDEHAGSDIPVWVASGTSFLLTYGFALALVGGFALYQRFRDSELRLAALQRAWNGARLAALRMQLSPHTLFNLLHTIRGQIGWDPGAAQSMIVQLGNLLRRLLTAGERDFSRLTDELDFVRLYLELQQRRFADRLTLVLPDPADLPRTWVPSLILQPLIENAVTHGLAEHSGPVTVRVEISTSDDRLTLRVTNTMAARGEGQRDGVGLRNVRERLAVQFGRRAAFDAGPTEVGPTEVGPTEVGPTEPGAAEVEPAGAGEWRAEIRIPLLGEGPPARGAEPHA